MISSRLKSLILFLVFWNTLNQRNLTYGVPLVTGKQWIVVATHPLAAQAGVKILIAGGNAVDAAVAVATAIGVVEPWFSGIFGGSSWILYYSAKDKKVIAVDATGMAPHKATAEFYSNLGELPKEGILSAVIPGAFYGWMLLLKKYGTKNLEELFEPAIELAEKGFPISAEFASWSKAFEKSIAQFPSSAKVFLKDGKTPGIGEIFVQPDLAKTFKKVIEEEKQNKPKGRKASLEAALNYFYKGPIAKAIVKFSNDNRGLFTENDFAQYKAQIVDPIKISYRGYKIYECPPSSQGIVLLEALNILEGYDLKNLGPKSPEAIHLMVEATKLAFADREYYVGDPKFVNVPVEKLLSKEYAEIQRKRIEPKKAHAWPIPKVGFVQEEAGNTTVIAAADRLGNLISVTTSLGLNWLVVEGTGIVLNNRIRMYHLDQGHPNRIEPGKRVRFTANPVIVLKEGKVFLAIASPGVDVQPQAQLQGIVNIIDFGMNIQDAVSAPRWVSTAFPDTNHPHNVRNTLQLELILFQEMQRAIADKGHKIEVLSDYSGNLVGIMIHPKSGAYMAGADPRREAQALGW